MWYEIYKTNVQTVYFNIKDNNYNLQYSKKSIDGLLSHYFTWNVNLDPEYQRDLVWSNKDKEDFITSVLEGTDIGKIVIIDHSYEYSKQTTVEYEILDGKQRLSTLIDFYLDRWKYRGYYYSELDVKLKYRFNNATISVAEYKTDDVDEKIKLFLSINDTGITMSREHLNNIRTKYIK